MCPFCMQQRTQNAFVSKPGRARRSVLKPALSKRSAPKGAHKSRNINVGMLKTSGFDFVLKGRGFTVC